MESLIKVEVKHGKITNQRVKSEGPKVSTFHLKGYVVILSRLCKVCIT